jgi:hypothetical protein
VQYAQILEGHSECVISTHVCLSRSVHVGALYAGAGAGRSSPHRSGLLRLHALHDCGGHALRSAAAGVPGGSRLSVRPRLRLLSGSHDRACVLLRVLVGVLRLSGAGVHAGHVQLLRSDSAQHLLPRGAAVLHNEHLPPASQPTSGAGHVAHQQRQWHGFTEDCVLCGGGHARHCICVTAVYNDVSRPALGEERRLQRRQ